MPGKSMGKSRSSGFRFQKCFSRNFQFHRRDASGAILRRGYVTLMSWNGTYSWKNGNLYRISQIINGLFNQSKLIFHPLFIIKWALFCIISTIPISSIVTPWIWIGDIPSRVRRESVKWGAFPMVPKIAYTVQLSQNNTVRDSVICV